MNTKLRQKAKDKFEKDFFKPMNNAVFGKTMENVRTKSSYYKIFRRKFIRNRNEKTQTLMNNLVYLGLPILDLSKTVMYEFWYDYLKPKYGANAKLCYMYTDSFIAQMIFTKILQKILKQDLTLQILK